MPRNLLGLTLASVLASVTAASAADYRVEPDVGYMPGPERGVVAVEEDEKIVDIDIDLGLGLFDDDEDEAMSVAPDEPEPDDGGLFAR